MEQSVNYKVKWLMHESFIKLGMVTESNASMTDADAKTMPKRSKLKEEEQYMVDAK